MEKLHKLNIMCASCSYVGLVEEAEDEEVVYFRCYECGKVTCLYQPEARFHRFADKLPVPFVRDWVEYKGETFLAQVDYVKSYACRRAVVNLAHCLTYDLPIKTVNWNPEHFKPHPRLSEWR